MSKDQLLCIVFASDGGIPYCAYTRVRFKLPAGLDGQDEGEGSAIVEYLFTRDAAGQIFYFKSGNEVWSAHDFHLDPSKPQPVWLNPMVEKPIDWRGTAVMVDNAEAIRLIEGSKNGMDMQPADKERVRGTDPEAIGEALFYKTREFKPEGTCRICKHLYGIGNYCQHIYLCLKCHTFAGSGLGIDPLCRHLDPVANHAIEAVSLIYRMAYPTGVHPRHGLKWLVVPQSRSFSKLPYPFCWASQIWAHPGGAVLAEINRKGRRGRVTEAVLYDANGQLLAQKTERVWLGDDSMIRWASCVEGQDAAQRRPPVPRPKKTTPA